MIGGVGGGGASPEVLERFQDKIEELQLKLVKERETNTKLST